MTEREVFNKVRMMSFRLGELSMEARANPHDITTLRRKLKEIDTELGKLNYVLSILHGKKHERSYDINT